MTASSTGCSSKLSRRPWWCSKTSSTDASSVDDALCDGLKAWLGDDGLVDLAVCVSKYVGTGRLITVLDLDQACTLPWTSDEAQPVTAP